LSSIQVRLTLQPKTKPTGDLGFGQYFTDHWMNMRYLRSVGWCSSKVEPYSSFSIDPGASVLHYGQALFEGMKAFYQTDGRLVLFRPEFNYHRMKEGAERLCMEMPSLENFLKGISTLVKVDQDWVPKQRGSSLYLRPTLIGTEAFLGVRPSDEYLFFVIASPVSSYYKEGLGPVKIWVETEFVRAAPGGLGATKAAANYAGSLKAAYRAKQKGYSQVLWLDVHHEYVEEVGTMNVFFVINGEVHTPSLDGTILGGGVRSSVIELLRESGMQVHERKIKWSEITEAAKLGQLTEAFGTGTAAVISPIGQLDTDLGSIDLKTTQNAFKIAKQMYQQITDIQYGDAPDKHGWIVPL
jgi:branched-chain amino acid aminotransferase